MSTTQKRATRPVNPKAKNPTQEQVPVVPEVITPAPTNLPTEAVESNSSVEVSSDVKSETRVGAHKSIGICISAARVRRHMDKMYINAELEGQISNFKSQLASYNVAKSQLETKKKTVSVEETVEGKTKTVQTEVDLTPEDVTSAQAVVNALSPLAEDFRLKIEALSRERTRFSNEAPIAMAIICDNIIEQLLEATMEHVQAKSKIVKVAHLHKAGVENLSLFPLIKTLPTYVNTRDRLNQAAQEQATAAQLASVLAKAEKDFRKKYNVKVPKKKPEPAPAQEEVVEALPAEDEDEEHDTKVTFKFYIGAIRKGIVERNPEYKSIRISTEIREYLSDLITEFIQRMSQLVPLMANAMKNKTVSDQAILRTLELLLIDGHHASRTVSLNETQIPSPEAVKAEAAKRDAEKAAGREYKVDVEKLPKTKGYLCKHEVSYPSCGYVALYTRVDEKLKMFETLSEKDKAIASTQ